MVVRASRRALFRGVFAGSGFELQRDAANDILMRINQSLDPVPLTDGMWQALVAARRAVRAAEYDRAGASGIREDSTPGRDPVRGVRFDHFPVHVAKDLTLLLRLEALVREGTVSSAGSAVGAIEAETGRRDRLVAGATREVERYLGPCDELDAIRRQVVESTVGCLVRASAV